MKKVFAIGWMLLTGFSTFSCIKESDDGNCPRKLTIVPRWVHSAPQDQDESVYVRITDPDSNVTHTTTPVTGKEVTLSQGIHQFIEWETARNVTIDMDTVSVAVQDDGYLAEPGPFSAGKVSEEVLSESSQTIYLPLYLQTRELVIEIQFTGNGVSFIRTVAGWITGIARSRDINNGFSPTDGSERPEAYEEGSVVYTFSSSSNGLFYGSNRLLGISGNSDQILYLNVLLTTDTYTYLNVDVSEALDGFHTVDVTDPYYITLILNIGADFDMEIIDWEAGTESNLIAD